MNKKDYQRPAMKVVQLQHRSHIMAVSSYETSGQGNTSIMEMDDEEDL